MKCSRCGAEIRVGSIYCSLCGHEAQIVSDKNLLEEEMLEGILKEETYPKQTSYPKAENSVQRGKKKKKNHKPLIITLCCLVVVILAGCILIPFVQKRNNNSFVYQMKKADSYFEKREYVKSLKYYEKALSLQEDNVDVLLKMVEVHNKMEEEHAAVDKLHEIILIDPNHKEAYRQLIAYYEKRREYDTIVQLAESVSNEEIKELFEAFLVHEPIFSLKPGTYDDSITIQLFGQDNCDIYYTLDGSDPREEGQVYDTSFRIDEQKSMEITAVCCNEYGLFSELVKGKFSVEFKKPDMPIANPDGGNFHEADTIELKGSEGSSIYYTWDGTDPTVDSMLYTEPIPVPEGNNVLSVILIDEHGMMSDVLKCNYKYYP